MKFKIFALGFYLKGPKNLSSKCGVSEFLVKGCFHVGFRFVQPNLLATATRSAGVLLAVAVDGVVYLFSAHFAASGLSKQDSWRWLKNNFPAATGFCYLTFLPVIFSARPVVL
jgi:hypothetical protein